MNVGVKMKVDVMGALGKLFFSRLGEDGNGNENGIDPAGKRAKRKEGLGGEMGMNQVGYRDA